MTGSLEQWYKGSSPLEEMVRLIHWLSKLRQPTHDDARRALWAVTVRRQEYVLIVYRATARLGDHYHQYDERWIMLRGTGLVMTQTAGHGSCHDFRLMAGSSTLIKANNAHAITAEAGSVLLIIKPAGAYQATRFRLE